MKVEGHTFVWYLLLMPFAKAHFHYPYPMQILNWIFCFLALILFWLKAPFSNFVKVLTTFSFPFLFMYSVIARCYAIGILLLFVLAILFKNKLKHPILYPITILITANTSAIALIGAIAFGILYCYDMFKNHASKKNIFIAVSIFVICSILIFLQHFGFDSTIINPNRGIGSTDLSGFILRGFPILNYFILFVLALGTLIGLRKSKPALFFLIFTYSLIFYGMEFVYKGYAQHHYFLLLYLLISIWIASNEDKLTNLSKKIFNIFLIGILIFNVLVFRTYLGTDIIIKDDLIKSKVLINTTIIVPDYENIGMTILPYKYKYNFKVKNYCFDKNVNYDAVKNVSLSDFCNQYTVKGENIGKIILDSERLYNLIEGKTLILLKDTLLYPDEFMIQQRHKIIFNKKHCIANTLSCLWEIKKE